MKKMTDAKCWSS